MTEHIAFYGKGGTGKSSVVTNTAVALAESGRRVAVIGCDPKADSVALLHPSGGRAVHAALGTSGSVTLADVVGTGHAGVLCIEVGDVMSTGCCVAYGINRALSIVLEAGLPGAYDLDLVLYDMPGETGCAGFSIPLLDSLITTAYLVTSADLMSLYGVNAQLQQLHRNCGQRVVGIGIVANGLNASFEEALVKDFALHIAVPLVASVPRSLVVRQCELYGKTVLEAASLSNQSYAYRKLARLMGDHAAVTRIASTHPRAALHLQAWARNWGDRMAELEHGLLEWGAGI